MRFSYSPIEQFKSLESVLSHHCLFLFDDDYKMDEVFDCFDSPNEVLLNIHSLKEQGNSFFKQNLFSAALETYLKAIKFLCVIATVISENLQDQEREIFAKELAIPLHLNVAMCLIRLSNFKRAILFSSMALGLDPMNVKALYRRGLSYSKTNCFEEARKDLSKAKKLDDKNVEVERLLWVIDKELKGKISVSEVDKELKGKTSESEESQNPSSSLLLKEPRGREEGYFNQLPNAINDYSSMVPSKDKGTLVCMDERVTSSLGSALPSPMDVDVPIDKSELPTECLFKVSSNLEEKRKRAMPSKSEGIVVSPNFKVSASCRDDLSQAFSGRKLGESKAQFPDNVIDNHKTIDSNCQSSRQSPKKLPSKRKVTYINKKRSCSSLQLSREDVERLRNGKELVFFNSRSLTTLKVKTFKKFQFPSQMDDLKEAHQNHQVRVAEVSECEDNLDAYRSVEASKDLITLSEDDPNPNPIVEVSPIVLQVESKAVEDFQVKDLPLFSATSSPKTLQTKIFTSPTKGGKEIKSSGSKAVLAAKKRALRVARYKLGATKSQQQVQQSRRKCRTGPNLPRTTNPNFVGGKRNCLLVQNDDSSPKKKLCFGIPNLKLDGDTQCKCISFSNVQVDGTNRARIKPAHELTWKARCWL